LTQSVLEDVADTADLTSAPTSASPKTTPRHPRLPVGESVARGAFALLGTQPLTWGASLLTGIMVPRLLGADGLGEYTIALTIASMGATATSLGISEYLVRRVAQQPATLDQDAGVALLVQTITTFVGALMIALIVWLGFFSLVELRLLSITLVGVMLITPAQTVLLSSFRGRELHRQYAWFNAAGVVLGQLGGLLALLVGGGVLAYAAVAGAATIGSTAVAWKVSGLRPRLPAFGRSLWRQCWQFTRGGFPFFTWNMTLSITGNIDRVLLGLFVPAAEVGWYAAAFRVISIPIFLPTLIITPLFPALSRSAHEPDTIRRTLTRTMRILLLLMAPLSAGIAALSPVIPALLGWPADFDNASPLIATLALQLPIVGVDMILGVVLMAIGRQGRWVVVGLSTAVLKIVLNFAAIPLFENLTGNGAIGASLVTLITELVMFGGAIVLIPKHLLDARMAVDAARIALASLATFAVASNLLHFGAHLGVVLAVPAGALAYLAVALALGVVSRDDVRPLRVQLGHLIPGRS
jgi:O-antigen/teichoic acid export membrane protein